MPGLQLRQGKMELIEVMRCVFNGLVSENQIERSELHVISSTLVGFPERAAGQAGTAQEFI